MNAPHLARIQKLLDALGQAEDKRALAYASIVLEDAYMAVRLALSCGLTSLDAVRRNHRLLLSQAVMEQADGCVCAIVAEHSEILEIGQVATCPMHPERRFFRGPSGMAS